MTNQLEENILYISTDDKKENLGLHLLMNLVENEGTDNLMAPIMAPIMAPKEISPDMITMVDEKPLPVPSLNISNESSDDDDDDDSDNRRSGSSRSCLKKGEKKIYVCQFPGCNYQSAYTTNYNSHVRKHTGTKPFSCTFDGCSYASDRKGNVVIHYKARHLGIKQKRKGKDGYMTRKERETMLLEEQRRKREELGGSSLIILNPSNESNKGEDDEWMVSKDD